MYLKSAKILTCKTYEMCDQTELAGSVISEAVFGVLVLAAGYR